MQCKTIGLDLAKNIFQVCGVSEHSKVIFNRKLKRSQLIQFFRPAGTDNHRDGSLLLCSLLGARAS